MKTIYGIVFCLFLILALNSVKCEKINEIESQKSLEDVNDHQSLSNDEVKAKLLNLLLADLELNDSNEQDDDESGLDKRMTYRYGKRMTYRYGKKRSAMPYRFGKRAYGHEASAQQIIDYLRLLNDENDDSRNKRMTYRYGRSVNKK